MKLSPIVLIATSFLLSAFPLCVLGQSPVKSGFASSGYVLYQASSIPDTALIQPQELVKLLQAGKAEKPLMLQVGSRVLYEQAHISGSEYIGPGSSADGLEKLRQRLQSLPRSKFIVLYCGCCPWSHCPNIKPAWDLAQSMGFSKLKVLYIANNFGTDWVDKGYPTSQGK